MGTGREPMGRRSPAPQRAEAGLLARCGGPAGPSGRPPAPGDGSWARAAAAGVLPGSGLLGLAAALAVAAAPGLPARAAMDEAFDPARYSGLWYEVASLKTGFAAEGQGDCHCTQGLYETTGAAEDRGLTVSTFCVHGSPEGKISGIQGRVRCLGPEELASRETALEMQEMIEEKCALRFPAIPFLPSEPYDVIDTDYRSFALVQGSKDRSFVQIYSRTPKPGRAFIARQKGKLAKLGFDAKKIKDTPQDCPDAMMDSMKGMMTSKEMRTMMENTMYVDVDAGGGEQEGEGPALAGNLQLAGPRSFGQTLKDLGGLLRMNL